MTIHFWINKNNRFCLKTTAIFLTSALLFSILAPPFTSASAFNTFKAGVSRDSSGDRSASPLVGQTSQFQTFHSKTQVKKVLSPEQFVSQLNRYVRELETLSEKSESEIAKRETNSIKEFIEQRLFFTAPLESEESEFILGAYQGDLHRVNFLLEYSTKNEEELNLVRSGHEFQNALKASMGTLRSMSMIQSGRPYLIVNALPRIMVRGELSHILTDEGEIEKRLFGKKFRVKGDWEFADLRMKAHKNKKPLWPGSEIMAQIKAGRSVIFSKSKHLSVPRRGFEKKRGKGQREEPFSEITLIRRKGGANMDWVWKKWFPKLSEKEYSLKKSYWLEEFGVYFFAAIIVGLPILFLSGWNVERALVSTYLASRGLFIFGHLPMVAKRFGFEAPPQKLFDAMILTLINVALLHPAFSLSIYVLFSAPPITHLIWNLLRSLEFSAREGEDITTSDHRQLMDGLQLDQAASSGITRRKIIRQEAGSQAQKSLNISEDFAFGDSANYEEWKRIVAQGFREGVNYRDLLEDKRGIIIGDTDHGALGVQRGFIEHLRELKEAGITHLGIEISSDKNLNDMANIAQGMWIPHRDLQLIETAKSLGLEVIFIDMPLEQKKSFSNDDIRNFQRGVYMGQFIEQFFGLNPEAKMAAIVGYGHIEPYDEIPAQISYPVSYVASVSQGQRGHFMGESLPFMNLAVVSAIAEATEGKSPYGYLDLTGHGLPVEGVIHYQRPYEEAPFASSLEALPSQESSDIALRMPLPVVITPETRISEPLHRNYSNVVDPHVYTWERTNEEKIIDFVSKMSGLNNGQKFYLAALLLSYSHNKFHHNMGGSIVSMGFVPEGQFFEFTIVDTHHYPYNPEAEYGSFKANIEISLRTLQEDYGFADIIVEELHDLPPINISHNPENPSSLLKFVIFILAVLKNPKRVVTAVAKDSRWVLAVLDSEIENASPLLRYLRYITALNLDDFMLSPIEEKLNQIKYSPRELRDTLTKFEYIHTFEIVSEQWVGNQRLAVFPPTPKNLAMRAVFQALNKAEDLIFKKHFDSLFEETALNARKELRVLNQSEIESLAAVLDEVLEALGHVILQAEKLFRKYPDLLEAQEYLGGDAIPEASRRGRLYGTVKIRVIYEELKEKYEQLLQARREISEIYPQLPPAAAAPAKKVAGKKWFGLLPPSGSDKRSGPGFIFDSLQLVQHLRKSAYPLYWILAVLVAPLFEEKIFRDLVIGGRDITLESFFSRDPMGIGIVVGLSIFVFSAAHVIVKWITNQTKPKEERAYHSFKDAAIDFTKYIFPSIIFTVVYLFVFTFVPVFYFHGVRLDAYAMSSIAHGSYNAFVLFLNSRLAAKIFPKSALKILREFLPLAMIPGSGRNGDLTIGDKSIIETKLEDGELDLELDSWTITEIEELKDAKVRVHVEKGIDMFGDLIDYPVFIEFIGKDEERTPVKMSEVRNSKRQLLHVYRRSEEIDASYLTDLANRYGELTLQYHHLDKDGRFTATGESYLPIFRNRKDGEIEAQLDAHGKTKMIWQVEHKLEDPEARSLKRLEPVYGITRYLFPLELEFINELIGNLQAATYGEISDAQAKTIAWTLVRLQRKSLEFLKQEGLLNVSDMTSLERLYFDPIALADLAERLLQQIQDYKENGLDEWQIGKLLTTKLVPWSTLLKWRENHSLDIIFEALPHPDVEAYLAQREDAPVMAAEITWGLFENLSRMSLSQEHRIWLVNIILAKYGVDHGMQIDQVMKSLLGKRVLYVGLENVAVENSVAMHLVKAGMDADSISPFAGTNGMSTELFSKGDIFDIPRDSNKYDLIIAEPFFDEYFDLDAMKEIGYSRPQDYYTKAASEIMRTLKDDGKFLAMLSHKVRASEFKAAFKGLGFVVKEIGAIGNYPLFEIVKSKLDEEKEDILRRYRNRILDSYDLDTIVQETANLEYLVKGIKVQDHDYLSTYVLPAKEHLERVKRAIDKAEKNNIFKDVISSFKTVFGNSPDVNISQTQSKLVKFLENLDSDISIAVVAYYQVISKYKFKVKDQEIERNFIDIDPYTLIKEQKDVWDSLLSTQIAEFYGLMVNQNVMLDQLEEKAKLILALKHLEDHKKDRSIKDHYEAVVRRVISRISLSSHALLDYLGLLSTLVPTYLQELLESEDDMEFFELERTIKEALEKLNVLFKQDWAALSSQELIGMFEELSRVIGHPRDLNSHINRLRGKLTRMNFRDRDEEKAEGVKKFIEYFLYPYYLVFVPNILNMQIQFLKTQGENVPETLYRVWQQFGERVGYMENERYKYNETRNRFSDWWNGLTVVEVILDKKKEEKPVKIPFRIIGEEKEFFISHKFLNDAELVKIANPIGLQRVLGEILKNCAEKNGFERQSWDARVNITFNRKRKKRKWGVEITIEDDGKGISLEMLALDPLTGRQMIWNRAGSTGGKERGVGMSEAWRIIVKDSKGTIEADNGSSLRLPQFNEKGEITRQGGARITIWLPIVMNGTGVTNKTRKRMIRRGKQRRIRSRRELKNHLASVSQGNNLMMLADFSFQSRNNPVALEDFPVSIKRAIERGIEILPGLDPQSVIMPMVGGTSNLFGDSQDQMSKLFDDFKSRYGDSGNQQKVSIGNKVPEWLLEAANGDRARTAKSWDMAIESYKKALDLNPPLNELGRIWVVLGLSYFNLAESDQTAYEEAINAFKTGEGLLLPDNPIRPSYTRVVLGDVYFARALHGIEVAKKLLEDEAEIEFLSVVEEEEFSRKKTKVEKEIARDFGRSILAYRWALLQTDLTEYNERRAVENQARSLMNLGLIEESGNLLTLYLDKYSKGNPDTDTDNKNMIFYSLLGDAHVAAYRLLPEGAERQDRLEQMLECRKKARFLAPENIYMIVDLIAAYLEAEKVEDAKDLIRELAEIIFRVNSAKIQNEHLNRFVRAFQAAGTLKEKFGIFLKEIALESLEQRADDQNLKRWVQMIMSMDAQMNGFAPLEIRLEALKPRFDFFNEKPKQRKDDFSMNELIKKVQSLRQYSDRKVVDFLNSMLQTEITKFRTDLKIAMEESLSLIEETLARQEAENEALRLQEAAQKAERVRKAIFEERAQEEVAQRRSAQILPELWRARIKAIKEAQAAERIAKEREAQLRGEREQAEALALAEATRREEERKTREKEEALKARRANALEKKVNREPLLNRILEVLPNLRIRDASTLAVALFNAEWSEKDIEKFLEGIRVKELYSGSQIKKLVLQIKDGRSCNQIFPFMRMEDILREILEMRDPDTIYATIKNMSQEIDDLKIADSATRLELRDVYINAATIYLSLVRRIKRKFVLDEVFQIYYKFVSSLGKPDFSALDPVIFYQTGGWKSLVQLERKKLIELIKTPQTDLKKAVDEFYVMVALDYLENQMELGMLTSSISMDLYQIIVKTQTSMKYTTDYEDIDMVNTIVGSSYGFLHVWLPMVLERESKNSQTIKNAEPLVKAMEDYLNLADQGKLKWGLDSAKYKETFQGMIQKIGTHLPLFLAEFKKLKLELTQDEKNLFRFVEGEEGLKLLPKILGLRILFLPEDKNQADQIKFDKSTKEKVEGAGGRWWFLQKFYDRLGLNWFGQAFSPSLIESGLWVGTMTILTSLALERIFGIPLEIGPPFFIILGFFQLSWHILHGFDKASEQDKVLITVLSGLLLIPYSIFDPTGIYLTAGLPFLLFLPHLVVNLIEWHTFTHHLPEEFLRFSFFQDGLWEDFFKGFQVTQFALMSKESDRLTEGGMTFKEYLATKNHKYINSLVDQYSSSTEIDLIQFFDRLERQLIRDLEHLQDLRVPNPHEIPWLVGETVALFLNKLYFKRAIHPTQEGANRFSNLFLELFLIKRGATVIDISQLLLGNLNPDRLWLNPDASRAREIEWLNIAMVIESKKALEEALAKDDLKLETPLVLMESLSRQAGERKLVLHKAEFLQPRKAFKIRAQAKAFVLFKMFAHNRDKIIKLVTASTGNHGLNTAYAVHLLKKLYPNETKNLTAEIYTSPSIKSVKMDAIQSQPYTKVVTEDDEGRVFGGYDQANAHVKLLEEKDKSSGKERTLLHIPHGDEFVVAGYATTGFEIFDRLERMGLIHKNIAVTVPMGSGGHAAGVAWVLKTLALRRGVNIKVIGVQTEKVNAVHQSLRAGKVKEVPVESEHDLDEDQIAVAKPEEFAVKVLLKTLDASVIVENDKLIEATRKVWQDLRNNEEASIRNSRLEVTAGMNQLALESFPELFSDREVIIGIATGGNVSEELWKKIEARAPPSYKTIFSKLAVKMRITLSVILSMFLIPAIFSDSILLRAISHSGAQTYKEQTLQQQQDLKQSIESSLNIKVSVEPALKLVSFKQLERGEATFSINPSIALAVGGGNHPILTHRLERTVKVKQALLGQSHAAIQGIFDVWSSPVTANQSAAELVLNSVRNGVVPKEFQQKDSTEDRLELISNILGDKVPLQNNNIQEENQRFLLNAGDLSSSIEEVLSFLDERKEENRTHEEKKAFRKYEVVIVTDGLLKTKGEIEELLLADGMDLNDIKEHVRIVIEPREEGKFNLKKLIRAHRLADGYSLRVLNKNGLWSLEGLMGKIWQQAFQENRIVFIENSLFGIKVVAYSQ